MSEPDRIAAIRQSAELHGYSCRFSVVGAVNDADADVSFLLDRLTAVERERDEALAQLQEPYPLAWDGGRLMLNEYGRRCYDKGREQAEAALLTLQRHLRELIEQWQKRFEVFNRDADERLGMNEQRRTAGVLATATQAHIQELAALLPSLTETEDK